MSRAAWVLVAVLAASPAGAQELELWVDGAGTHAEPPASVDTSGALYSLIGGRGVARFPWGDVSLSGRYGEGVGALDARWLLGVLDASAGRRFGRWIARTGFDAQVLSYTTPFTYSVLNAALEPSLAGTAGSLGFAVRGTARLGRWKSSAPDTTRPGMTHPTATIDGDLRLLGAGTTLGHPLGPLWIALDVDAMDVTNGAVDGGYVTGDLRARVSVGAVQMELWGTGQRNPLETEWGYGASAAWAPVPAAILQLFAGRTVTDPVYGTEGSFSAGLAVSWRLARHDAPPPLVARPGEWTGEGRRVQFRIVAPGAETVELVGDFSGWEPITMDRSGRAWTTTVTLPAGVHHFGFLVDGAWTVPDDAPGIVADGWGRTNASLVIEPRGDERAL